MLHVSGTEGSKTGHLTCLFFMNDSNYEPDHAPRSPRAPPLVPHNTQSTKDHSQVPYRRGFIGGGGGVWGCWLNEFGPNTRLRYEAQYGCCFNEQVGQRALRRAYFALLGKYLDAWISDIFLLRNCFTFECESAISHPFPHGLMRPNSFAAARVRGALDEAEGDARSTFRAG